MIDALSYDEIRQDTRELLDYASEWSFHVYFRVLARTQNRELAGLTASLVYDKILNKELKNAI